MCGGLALALALGSGLGLGLARVGGWWCLLPHPPFELWCLRLPSFGLVVTSLLVWVGGAFSSSSLGSSTTQGGKGAPPTWEQE